jgi:hypothetical protein
MSSAEIGVPLADGCATSPVRERASASPARGASEPAPASSSGRRASMPLEPLSVPLRDLQEWFAATILDPRGSSASVRDDVATRQAGLFELHVERLVRPSATLSGAERLDIYRQAYRSRLIECLADDYPAVRHALGEKDFDDACRSFIDEHPSRSPSLNHYGRPFAAFLRGRRHPLATFAADLAILEWALVEVIHAGASSRLSHGALAAVPASSWAGARFVASSTVRLLELEYPANRYFQAYRQGDAPSPPAPAWSATAVFRDGATLWRMDLSRAMHLLLRQLFGGRSLGEAVESLVAEPGAGEHGGSDVMQWFRDWVRHGFFAKIDVPGA